MNNPTPLEHQRPVGATTVRCTRPAIVAGLVGAALLLFAAPIADFVARTVPLAFVTTSGGTALASFGDIGDTVLRRLGIALLLAAAAAAVGADRWRTVAAPVGALARRVPSAVRRVAVPLAVFVPPFAVYTWLSSPHQMYSTNSRIHWVDYFVGGDRGDDFFYAFGQLPHAIFYDHPNLWHGLNAGLWAVSMYAVLRRVSFGRIGAAGIALAASFGSMVLLFADTGEDVLLNLLLLTWLVGAMTTRSAPARGVMLALVITGRPEFFSMLAAYALVAVHDLWFTAPARQTTWWRSAAARLHLTTLCWAAGGILASQLLFELLGRRYMFTNGQILDLGPLAHLTPFELDGFTISVFSGAYAGHFLWVMPIGFSFGLMANLPSLWRRSGADTDHTAPTDEPAPIDGPDHPEHTEERDRLDGRPADRHLFVTGFALSATVVTVVLHEIKPTQTFCVRYLSYTLPFLVIGGAIGLRRIAHRRPVCRHAVWLFAIASLFALPVDPLAPRDTRAARPESSLLPYAPSLRDAVDERPVIVSFGGVTTRNAMAYLFQVPITSVSAVPADGIDALIDRPAAPSILVVRPDQLTSEPDPDMVVRRTDELIVLAIG